MGSSCSEDENNSPGMVSEVVLNYLKSSTLIENIIKDARASEKNAMSKSSPAMKVNPLFRTKDSDTLKTIYDCGGSWLFYTTVNKCFMKLVQNSIECQVSNVLGPFPPDFTFSTGYWSLELEFTPEFTVIHLLDYNLFDTLGAYLGYEKWVSNANYTRGYSSGSFDYYKPGMSITNVSETKWEPYVYAWPDSSDVYPFRVYSAKTTGLNSVTDCNDTRYTSSIIQPLYDEEWYITESSKFQGYVKGIKKVVYEKDGYTGEFIIDYGNGELDNIVIVTENGVTCKVDLSKMNIPPGV